MPARLALSSLVLVATLASATSTQRVYVVRWPTDGDVSVERRALVEQVDRRLRDELARCGMTVLAAGEAAGPRGAVVLRPRLEVAPSSLTLQLLSLRDQKVLGTSSTKASGTSRKAQLRGVVSRVCDEARRLE